MEKITNKSVLVVGWEFPPRMVGGLAIATHGLVEAMSHYIEVHLILPFADENTPQIDNVTIYGLNQIEQNFTEEQMEVFSKMDFEIFNTHDVFSYPFFETEETVEIKELIERKTINTRKVLSSYLDVFKSEEVYGMSLWKKLSVFKELVAVIASDIDFDIIHCHDWLTFDSGKKLKAVYGKPLCLHVHALETDRVGKDVRNDIYEIEYSSMTQADMVMPVSYYTKTQIIEHYNIPSNKITPIYNSIEPQDIAKWRHRIPQKIVTFLGRITQQKGPYFLLETIAKVVEKYKNVRFVIAGSGDQFANLVDASAYKQLSRYFIFAGFLKRHEVNALLATSDVYFMPSVSEPFGLTALEATRAGVPCVLTKQSGAAEVLSSALTADYWDTDLFANHIINLLKDNVLREQIAKESFNEMQKISWYHSAAVVVNEYLKIWKN